MKITIPTKTLSNALKLMATVALKANHEIDLLKCVEITAKESGDIVFRAFDGTVDLTHTWPGEVSNAGVVIVDNRQLRAAIDPKSKQTSMEIDGDNVIVSCDGATVAVATGPDVALPVTEGRYYPHVFGLGVADLRGMFGAVAGCMSTETTRYYLNGAHLGYVADEDALHCAATDGHRLGLIKIVAPEGAADMPDIIVPSQAVGMITKIKGDGPATVEIGSAAIRITTENIRITSKLVDGTFPDYGRVIPPAPENMMIARVKAFVGPLSRLVKMSIKTVRLEIEGSKTTIATMSSDGSPTNAIELSADSDSDPLTIGINAQYLLGLLKSLPSDDFVMRFSAANDPVRIESLGVDNVTYVCMPVQA